MNDENKHRALTPRQIVAELDKYIVGQHDAKRSVAIALRNRWRRQQLAAEMRQEVTPKNIILIGPTGVGKTEIARRLAALVDAPFVKVEASKFTEIGYVGKDVDSMVRDLAEVGVAQAKEHAKREVEEKARAAARERVLDLLLPQENSDSKVGFAPEGTLPMESGSNATREKFRAWLLEGALDEREVELDVSDKGMPNIEVLSNVGMEELEGLKEAFSNLLPKRTKKRRVKVSEALRILEQSEAAKLIDMDKVVRQALERVENAGIIFLDEIDKIAGRGERSSGPDVSREGVQRDILPIVEGATVTTKYGPVKTNHVLFIAAGAFHVSKPSDLIPELQGRFPIRVELKPLQKEDLERILREPKNSLSRQYIEMLKTEDFDLSFADEAIAEIAHMAATVNARMENIGARRLHTIMEKLLEEISFDAPEKSGAALCITRQYIQEKLDNFVKDQDLSAYIL